MWVGLEALKSQLVRGFVGNSKDPLAPDPWGLKRQPLTRASGSAWSSCIQLPVPVHFQLNFIPFFLLLILCEHGVLSKILSHGFFLYPMNWTEMRLCVCIWWSENIPACLSLTPLQCGTFQGESPHGPCLLALQSPSFGINQHHLGIEFTSLFLLILSLSVFHWNKTTFDPFVPMSHAPFHPPASDGGAESEVNPGLKSACGLPLSKTCLKPAHPVAMDTLSPSLPSVIWA